jgi:gas vesicle protein
LIQQLRLKTIFKEGSMSDSECGKSTVVKAFFMGAIVGAGLALLFAPYSGEETRRKIGEKKDDAKKAIKDTTEQLVKKGNELIDEGKKSIDHLKTEMSRLVDDGKKSIGTVKDEISKMVEESKTSVKKSIREELAALENELSDKKKKSKA